MSSKNILKQIRNACINGDETTPRILLYKVGDHIKRQDKIIKDLLEQVNAVKSTVDMIEERLDQEWATCTGDPPPDIEDLCEDILKRLGYQEMTT